MKRYSNLMTESARMRVSAIHHLRCWGLAILAGVLVISPVALWQWQRGRSLRQEHEALEAGYEPFRRLAQMNGELRTTAAKLVQDERLTLELSRRRPAATLLGIVGAAVAATDGALFVEHIEVSQTPPGSTASSANDKVLLDVVCTPHFDISRFTDELKKFPIAQVKIIADDLTTENGVDAKSYAIECGFAGATAPGTLNVK